MRAGQDLVVVAGARPNFVKIAPLLRELSRRSLSPITLVHTGQHRGHDMSGVFFAELGIPAPGVQLANTAGAASAERIMAAFDAYLVARHAPPLGVVVVGDVTSTMACALAAATRDIPIAHVEAGLRSFDRTMPEEIHRIVTDSVSELLLVSEPAAIRNLAREGVAPERVHFCGNVMIDSLVDQLPAARALDMPARLGVCRGGYAVVTLHRPSNVDTHDRLRELVELVQRLGRELPVLFPVHPRTDAMLRLLGLRDALARDERTHLLAPLGYREFLGLLEGARLVVTDSGGVQEETTYLGIPCITLRASTERPSTVSHGTNRLAGTNLDHAWNACLACLHGSPKRARPIAGWDGRAATRIVDVLASLLGRRRDVAQRCEIRLEVRELGLRLDPIEPDRPAKPLVLVSPELGQHV